MASWAKQHGLVLSPKVDFFRKATPPSQGFCAFAMEAIEAGELLLQLPLAACLRPMACRESFMDEQQKLMLQLLAEVLVRREHSSWLPYLRSLPRCFPTLPLWYTEEEKRFSKGTSVDTLLEASHIASDQEHPEIFPTAPSLEQLRWSASVVASRAFDSSAVGVVLAPFADALNHSGDPHTRMRDCGDHMVFHAERAIEKDEEVMNCYGLQGNTQWLMNGGFLDRSRPCDDLLVTPADVVSAVLDSLDSLPAPEADEADGSEDEDASLCSRVSLLQELGLGTSSFSISLAELLPDDLATLILVICMSDEEFLQYQQQRLAGAPAVIDLAGEEGEELEEQLLARLYSALLRLVALLRQRYETSLEEDEAFLEQLQEPKAKRHKVEAVLPTGVRFENAQNLLLLRIGQKRVLKALEEQAAECFAE